MELAGKVALITGASGTVGSGIVRSFLLHGATVVAPLRTDAGRQVLDKALDGVQYDPAKLDTPTLDVSKEADLKKLVEHLEQKYKELSHVVASAGAWWQKGTLTQQPLAEVEKEVYGRTTTHFLLAKLFTPLLAPEATSSYTIVTGAAGEQCFMPDISLVTFANAAQYGLSLALRKEFEPSPIRVNEARIACQIFKHEDWLAADKSTEGPWAPHSARAVGEVFALDLAGGKPKGEVYTIGAEQLNKYKA